MNMDEATKAEIRALSLKTLHIRVQSATIRGQSLMAYAAGETDKAERLGRKADRLLQQSFEASDAFNAYLDKL